MWQIWHVKHLSEGMHTLTKESVWNKNKQLGKGGTFEPQRLSITPMSAFGCALDSLVAGIFAFCNAWASRQSIKDSR